MVKGSGYRLPLQLTKEMKIALVKAVAASGEADDFPVALKVFRAGLLIYDVIGEDEFQAMYLRGIIKDDEVMFLMEKGLTKDFRPVKVEALLQAQELKILDNQFAQVCGQWVGLKESAKMAWLERAKKYPMLSNARKLVEAVKEKTKR